MQETHTRALRTGGGLFAVALAIVIATRPPFAGLSPAAMRALGIVSWAVINWILGTLDDYVVALIMSVSFVVFGVVPFPTAFSVFSTTTWWLVVGVIGMGVAVEQSGLLTRFALRTLLALPNTFLGQCAGLVVSGIILGPSLASVTGKAAIASRFVYGMSRALDLPDRSKHSTGLFMSMYLGYALSAPLYMTAGVCGFIVLGLLPPQYRDITWGKWLVASVPIVLPMLALVFLAILKAYDPGSGFRASKDLLRSQLASLEKPGRQEFITAGVLMATLLVWVTEPIHHVDSAIPAVLGLSVLIIARVLDRQAFDRLPWATLIFLGLILNLGTLLPKTGLDTWIGSTLETVLAPVAANPTTFLFAVGLLVVLLRFVMVSYNALTTLLMVSLMPLGISTGIHPWVLGTVIHVVGQAVFILPYQNPIYLIAYHGSRGAMNTHRQAALTSAVAIAGCLIGIIVAVMVWSGMGLVRPR